MAEEDCRRKVQLGLHHQSLTVARESVCRSCKWGGGVEWGSYALRGQLNRRKEQALGEGRAVGNPYANSALLGAWDERSFFFFFFFFFFFGSRCDSIGRRKRRWSGFWVGR